MKTGGRGGRARGLITLVVAIAVGVLSSPVPGYAVPSLQLDIVGGYYDPNNQTIIARGDTFTVYAILTPDTHSSVASQLAERYFISAALVPMTGPTASQLGSFGFNGTPIVVTRDMTYGIPPIEADGAAGTDPHDLQSHGIFQTYFSEFSFFFDPNNRAVPYDTALNAGAGPTLVGSDYPYGVSYVVAFQVDTSGLADGYAMHFDLYNEVLRDNGDIDRKKFAPFSHDAQSGSRRVPEAETLLLLGSGLVIAGLRLTRRGPRP
jgi:hypothetical protein